MMEGKDLVLEVDLLLEFEIPLFVQPTSLKKLACSTLRGKTYLIFLISNEIMSQRFGLEDNVPLLMISSTDFDAAQQSMRVCGEIAVAQCGLRQWIIIKQSFGASCIYHTNSVLPHPRRPRHRIFHIVKAQSPLCRSIILKWVQH